MAKNKKNKAKSVVWLKDYYDIDNMMILDHAVERFVQRIDSNMYDVKNPKNTIRTLMYGAVKEQLKSHFTVIRILNNNHEGAEYYTAQGWRFVITDSVVKTIERVKRNQN